MKRTAIVALAITVAGLILAAGPKGCHEDVDRPGRTQQAEAANQLTRPATVAPSEDPQHLRTELEAVYTAYLQAIQSENAEMLCSVLTSARISDLRRTFELNGMVFPDAYFTVFKKYSPTLPPLDKFRHIGVTQGDPYANLIYVGDMNGYLRKTGRVQRFLIIQFEKERGGWKYAAIVDPPLDIVPDLEKKLADEQVDFLQSKPFSAERIDFRP